MVYVNEILSIYVKHNLINISGLWTLISGPSRWSDTLVSSRKNKQTLGAMLYITYDKISHKIQLIKMQSRSTAFTCLHA